MQSSKAQKLHEQELSTRNLVRLKIVPLSGLPRLSESLMKKGVSPPTYYKTHPLPNSPTGMRSLSL
jgi:hypothetical protein